MSDIKLDSILAAISNAVHNTQKSLEQQSIKKFLDLFDTANDGSLSAKTVPLVLPKDHIVDDDEPVGVHQIPLAGLVDHKHLALDDLTVEFDCHLKNTGSDGALDSLEISFSPPSAIRKNVEPAKVKINYKTTPFSEGVAKINDKLYRTF